MATASDTRTGMAHTLGQSDPLGIMPGGESLYQAEVDRLLRELDGVGTPDRFAEVIRFRYPDLTDRRVQKLWDQWRPVAVRNGWEPTFYSRREARRFIVALVVWLGLALPGIAALAILLFWSPWIGGALEILLLLASWLAVRVIRRVARRDPLHPKVRHFYKHRVRGDGRIVADALTIAGWRPWIGRVIRGLIVGQIVAGIVGFVVTVAAS